MLAKFHLKKSLTFVVLSLVALVSVFLPANKIYAAYYNVYSGSFRMYEDTNVFKYYSDGLGVQIYCKNSRGNYQTMNLYRKIDGLWSLRATAKVYCSSSYEKLNYFYYPDAVSGASYYIRLYNSGYTGYTSTSSLTTAGVYVNPN